MRVIGRTWHWVPVMVLGLLATFSGLILAATDQEGDTVQSEILFPNDDGYYTYAPAAITTGTEAYVWWCQNKDPYDIRDYIYTTSRSLPGGDWHPRTAALGPGDEGSWDSVHVCDPAVIEGSFQYRGDQYNYALFYLGTDQWDNQHNQIGVAFSTSLNGPWIKYDANPIVTAPRHEWGVGQPAVTSIDRQGKLQLFYSHGGTQGTYVLVRELDFTDADNPVIGPAQRLSEAGLTTRDGSRVILHNIDVAYAPEAHRYVIIAPQHPFDRETPEFVASYLQLASVDADKVTSFMGIWRVEGGIGPALTGKPRNHNAGIMRTPFGELPDPTKVDVIFATGELGARWLWTYVLHHLALPLDLAR